MADMKVVIGGDVAGATTGLKTVQAELSKTAVAASKVDNSLAGIGKNAGQSIFNLTEKLRVLESNVFTEKSIAKVAAFNKEIEATKIQIAQLNNAGTAGFNSLGEAIAKTGNPLTKAFSGIRQLAYILPGIGIAGILAFATEPIFAFVSSLSLVSDAVKKMKDYEDRLNDAFAGGETGFVKATLEVSNLRIAIQQAKDGIITKGEALKLYNETIGKTTGAVHSLEAAETALNKNAEAYIQFTLLKAASNYALEKAAKSAFDAESARIKKAQEFASLSTRASVFSAGQSSAPGFVPGASNLNQQLAARADAAQKAKDKVIQIAEDAKKAETDIANKFLTDAQDIAKKFKFDFNAIAEPSTNKRIETIVDVIKKLRAELNALNTKQLELHTDEAKGRISALEGAIKELAVKFGIGGKEAGQKLYEGFNESPMFKGIVGLKTELLVQALKKDIETQMKADPIKLEPLLFIGTPDIHKGAFEDRLKAFDDLKEAFKKKVKDFQDLVKTTATDIGSDSLVALGDAIGTALKGGKVTGIFDSLLTSVGSQIQNLGKFLIKSGIQIKIAKEAFKKLLANPIASIIVGAGLVALGALIKSQIGKQAPGFASGVRNFQGGIVDVGERGPERIFLPTGSTVQPNNELQAYGSENGGQQLIARVQGQELVIMLDRARATIRRNG